MADQRNTELIERQGRQSKTNETDLNRLLSLSLSIGSGNPLAAPFLLMLMVLKYLKNQKHKKYAALNDN